MAALDERFYWSDQRSKASCQRCQTHVASVSKPPNARHQTPFAVLPRRRNAKGRPAQGQASVRAVSRTARGGRPGNLSVKHCPSCRSPRLSSIVVWLPFRSYRRGVERQPARVAQEHHCSDCLSQWSTYYGPALRSKRTRILADLVPVGALPLRHDQRIRTHDFDAAGKALGADG